MKVKVKPVHFEGKFTGFSYLKRIIFFKGIFGNSQDLIFPDINTKKFYRIVRFDKFGNDFSLAQTHTIDNQEIYVKVDPLQYNIPTFGT